MVLEILNILQHFDLAGLEHNGPEHIRIMAEAQKRATIDKDEFVGDPEFVDVPLARLLGTRPRRRHGSRHPRRRHASASSAWAPSRRTPPPSTSWTSGATSPP